MLLFKIGSTNFDHPNYPMVHGCLNGDQFQFHHLVRSAGTNLGPASNDSGAHIGREGPKGLFRLFFVFASLLCPLYFCLVGWDLFWYGNACNSSKTLWDLYNLVTDYFPSFFFKKKKYDHEFFLYTKLCWKPNEKMS